MISLETIDKRNEQFNNAIYNEHAKTNHYYDNELPYAFHLRAVKREMLKYIPLIYPDFDKNEIEIQAALMAAISHDLMEDTRNNYNDLLRLMLSNNYNNKILTTRVAEMTYAVTNYGRGRNREERMPNSLYKDIRETFDSDLLKICDRIANVKYSIYTESRMTKMYEKENSQFVLKVTDRYDLLYKAIYDLEKLF